MSKLIDDIVICVTVALCLGIALFLAFSVVERHADYPPTLITLFLGIAVAALTYRFLGGSQETEFRIGLLKLGGSAALLLGTTFVIGQRIRNELNIFDDSRSYMIKINQITSERDKLGREPRRTRPAERGSADETRESSRSRRSSHAGSDPEDDADRPACETAEAHG